VGKGVGQYGQGSRPASGVKVAAKQGLAVAAQLSDDDQFARVGEGLDMLAGSLGFPASVEQQATL